MSLLVRRPICHVHFILQNQRGCQIRVNLQRLVNVCGRLGLISECRVCPGQVGYGDGTCKLDLARFADNLIQLRLGVRIV